MLQYEAARVMCPSSSPTARTSTKPLSRRSLSALRMASGDSPRCAAICSYASEPCCSSSSRIDPSTESSLTTGAPALVQWCQSQWRPRLEKRPDSTSGHPAHPSGLGNHERVEQGIRPVHVARAYCEEPRAVRGQRQPMQKDALLTARVRRGGREDQRRRPEWIAGDVRATEGAIEPRGEQATAPRRNRHSRGVCLARVDESVGLQGRGAQLLEVVRG